MFTFGCGSYGQLGHNSNNDEYNPRKVSHVVLDLEMINNIQFALEIPLVFTTLLVTVCVFLFIFIQVFELMGKVVIQIACGRYISWNIAFIYLVASEAVLNYSFCSF